ncbi:hypothetical protein [Altererythrobacter rubellus]|uniref:Uncharacterized protein n=1 Tax=Altererythrobacter rubellus TaxID=2173831 RepID=A0A9Y2B9P4_9SPHN|nr:hypothetical protein [Altererythrobacter rubellus]WIW95512.1 hypothetical protein QQX03_11375 [Altererythrobacter rubellus]
MFSLQAQAASEPEQETEVTQIEEAAPEPEAEPATEENTVICRRTQLIGSKFTKRICGTQAEWDELARKGRVSTAEFQAKGAGIRQAGN